MKETKGIRRSVTIASPISDPPQIIEQIPPGRLFFSNTDDTILVVARVTRDVLVAPFHSKVFPQTYVKIRLFLDIYSDLLISINIFLKTN